MQELLLSERRGTDTGWGRVDGTVVGGVCYGGTGCLCGTKEGSRSCREGSTVESEVCSGRTGNPCVTEERPLWPWREGGSEAGVCSEGTVGLCDVAEGSRREGSSVIAWVCSGGAGGLWGVAGKSLWPFRLGGGSVDARVCSEDAGNLLDTEEELRSCREEGSDIAAGGDGNSDVEVLGCFDSGGEGAEGLADDRTEEVRSTRSAWGLVVFLSRDGPTW
jgi:hypothetical protein